jgi:hypothetical protein
VEVGADSGVENGCTRHDVCVCMLVCVAGMYVVGNQSNRTLGGDNFGLPEQAFCFVLVVCPYSLFLMSMLYALRRFMHKI